MNADGTGVVRHTTSPDDESEPTWDPLGGALLYTSLTPDLGARLYTVGVSATEPSPLSSADAALEFSPDKHAGVGGPP